MIVDDRCPHPLVILSCLSPRAPSCPKSAFAMDGVALGPDPVCNSTFGGGLTVPIFLSGPYASYAQLETAAVTWNVGESGKRCVHGQLHFWVLHPRLYCHRFALWLFCVRRRA